MHTPYLLLLLWILTIWAPSTLAESPETVVTSDTLDLVTEGSTQEFIFQGNVKVEDPKWTLTCENLTVQSTANKEAVSEKDGNKTSVQKVLACGKVFIHQGEREAQAGIAEIYPQEGKIILKDNPVLTHAEGKVEGYQITFYIDNQKDGTPGKVIVEGNPNEPKERPKVTLPALNSHFINEKPMDSSPLLPASS